MEEDTGLEAVKADEVEVDNYRMKRLRDELIGNQGDNGDKV